MTEMYKRQKFIENNKLLKIYLKKLNHAYDFIIFGNYAKYLQKKPDLDMIIFRKNKKIKKILEQFNMTYSPT